MYKKYATPIIACDPGLQECIKVLFDVFCMVALYSAHLNTFIAVVIYYQ